VPLLLAQVLPVATFSDTEECLRKLKETVLNGYNRINHYIGDSLSQFLAFYVKERMDSTLRMEWEKTISGSIPKPMLDDLDKFVKLRLLHKPFTMPPASPSYAATQPSLLRRTPMKCVACGEAHLLMRCNTFAGFDVERRNKLVREKHLCLNCFSERHGRKNCPSRFTCKSCGNKHHTLLHKDAATLNVSSMSLPPQPTVSPTLEEQPGSLQPSFPNTLVATLDHDGRTAKARVLLDSGCGVSLMTEELATNLRLKRYPHAVSLNGLGKQVHSKYYVITTLLSSSRSYSTQPITFAVVPHLVCTTIPEDKDEILASATLQNASLADPELGGRVDVFLGNLDLEDIVLSTYKDGKLRIITTPFGISVAGPISKGSSSALAVTSAVPDDLQNNLSRLWELDRVPEAPTHSPDDAKVLEHFNDTVRTVNGRISVTLPMKTDPPPLGDSRRQAMSRLFANEKSRGSQGVPLLGPCSSHPS